MSNKSIGNEGKVNWKHKVFASGHDLEGRPISVHHYHIFLILISIHASIFIIPWRPEAGIILLATLIKGWLNGV
ncbi:MAG: hypothetical protein GOV01_00620 [Candidatus Altiarchaeota archaeon]|nr:hypothetical protein [Candidatus Altiarchaeota archaeon]